MIQILYDCYSILDVILNERQSDKCICQLLGSGAFNKSCVITKECYRGETKPYTSNYYLTHQALYFIAGETHGMFAILSYRIASNKRRRAFI